MTAGVATSPITTNSIAAVGQWLTFMAQNVVEPNSDSGHDPYAEFASWITLALLEWHFGDRKNLLESLVGFLDNGTDRCGDVRTSRRGPTACVGSTDRMDPAAPGKVSTGLALPWAGVLRTDCEPHHGNATPGPQRPRWPTMRGGVDRPATAEVTASNAPSGSRRDGRRRSPSGRLRTKVLRQFFAGANPVTSEPHCTSVGGAQRPPPTPTPWHTAPHTSRTSAISTGPPPACITFTWGSQGEREASR